MMHKYVLCGRRLPSESHPDPEVYRMTIYAPNEVVAQSRFWGQLNSLKKLKRSHGELVDLQEVQEDDTYVKNFGVTLRYRSRTGQHNMYREVRETTSARAIEQVLSIMAGNYRARYSAVHIIDVSELKEEDLRREHTISFNDHKAHFPHPFPLAHVKQMAREHPFQKRRPTMPF